jgi:glycosyltransferase involved in cell wall biosynthesis
MRASSSSKPRLLVFIVAYNAETTIDRVLTRIPASLGALYDTEILIIDDASEDRTFERSATRKRGGDVPFVLTVLVNPENQGYGGNQKIGFHYAIERGFDVVALIHGDGQYAPELLPDLVAPVVRHEAELVMGSRLLSGGARKGGMPLYKLAGNRLLTITQNALLGSRLSEFHSGYRIYDVGALARLPFDLNTNDFHFDTEIIIQMMLAEHRVLELPIPTYYGDEICYVNGVKYARDVLLSTLKARVQDLDLVYDPKFDCRPSTGTSTHYRTKLGYASTHSMALSAIAPGTRVLDIGCGDGRLADALTKRGCSVVGIDTVPPPDSVELESFHCHDLDDPALPLDVAQFDAVLLLDVVEHLKSPEEFLTRLRRDAAQNPELKLIISTGNVGFALTRLLLLVGQFNYGKRGILDMTHTRLFTFPTLRRLLEGAGFEVLEMRGVPAPFPEAVGENRVGLGLLRFNNLLIRLRRPLFAYQSFAVAKPRPTLPYLLRRATEASQRRVGAMVGSR